MVLKWFLKRLCGSTNKPSPTEEPFVLEHTFIGSLKNSLNIESGQNDPKATQGLREWLFREPWFERFSVEPKMGP